MYMYMYNVEGKQKVPWQLAGSRSPTIVSTLPEDEITYSYKSWFPWKVEENPLARALQAISDLDRQQ